MSGICGVLHFDNRAGSPEELGGMLGRLATRGPEGNAAWAEGPIALGIARLATTPEAQSERLPLHHSPSNCAITGDIRIDNRDTLLKTLSLDAAGRLIGDAELVLHAYLRWGSDCLDHLLGDFAFALWDAPRKRLFCARDQLGMRQFIYHHTPTSLFAFATDADALLAHSAVPKDINTARIADFLEDLEATDLTSTFYRDLHRLPPAHAMLIEGASMRIWRYWAPALPTPLRLADDREYADAFLEVFTEAVRARLRAPAGKLGSMLSGGMDSGSVTAIAARLLQQSGAPPLPSFSATSADPACKETGTIRVAQTMPHLDPREMSLADFPAYADTLSRLSQQSAEPFDGPMAMLRAVYLAAQNSGITVMLDGAGGDTTLMADDMVAWRLRRGDLTGAWHEAVGAERFWGAELPSVKSFITGARYVIIPESLRRLRGRVGARATAARKARASMVAPDLAESVNMAARRDAHAKHVALRLDGRCEDRRALVTHPYIVVGRERYDRVAADMGIEPRDPFLDRRLLDFVLSLPADQIEYGGWPKVILRRAMDEILPNAVRWRTGKEHVGWQFEEAVSGHWLAEARPEWPGTLRRFVRPEQLLIADSPKDDELAVATRMTLGYLLSWMTR